MNKILATKLGKIEYSIKGKGEAILFVHGGHSNSKESKFHLGYDLEKYKLITPSRPGYGHTPLNGHMQPSSAVNL